MEPVTTTPPEAPPKPNYPIGSVDNALRMLALFHEQSSLRLSKVSEHLGIGRSTAHRLLAMLQYHGYVEQDPETRAYRSGPALMAIGLSALRDLDVRKHMRPHLEALCAEVNETVHLLVRQGTWALCIDSVEAPQTLRVGSRVGDKGPAHAIAGGKVLLAELSDDEVLTLYPDEELELVGPSSLTSRAALMRELDEVRERGYATNFAELEPDIGAVAKSIPSSSGPAQASVAVSAPLSRMPESRVPEMATALARTVERASAGFR